jgi:ADP-ribose pyrophosphatase YjhB (NUDIX family)
VTEDNGTRIAQLADEVRALAGNGIHYHVNEYDLVRYERLQGIAAELLALVDQRSTEDITRAFRGDLGLRTPLVAADAAIFDPDGRVLLVQRADSGLWCLHGGAADVGERPSHVAVREAFEESGLIVRATRLLAVYDNRAWPVDPEAGLHIYHLVFECEPVGGAPRTSVETTDVRWVTQSEAADLPLYRTHIRKVPAAFRLHKTPTEPPEFD